MIYVTEGCELGGGRCWALGTRHSCSLGRVRPWLLSPCSSCSITCRGWSLGAGQGLSPTPSCLEEGRRASGLRCLSHGGGHAGTWHVLTCPLLCFLCQQGHPPELGGDAPPAGTALAGAAALALGQACGSGQSQLRPLPSLPAGISAGEGGQAGTATQWWGIKGRKGRRKKNTPRHRQLTELALGWGRMGTAAGLLCQPGMGESLGRAAEGGSPLLCPGDPSLGLRETCRGKHHPLLSTREGDHRPAACALADEDPFSLSPGQ